MRKTLLCSLFLATLLGLATFGAPAAQAAQAPLGLVRSWGLFAKGLAAAFGWLEIGCSTDPSDACRTTPPPADQLNLGCSVDPNGCHSSAPPTDQLNIGCSMDPDGRCLPGMGS